MPWYLRYVDVANLSVAGCPVGVKQDSLAGGGLDVCLGEDNVREVSKILSSLSVVTRVNHVALSPISVADPSLPSGWQGALAMATIDPGPEFSIARPIIVDGGCPVRV